jgi:cupin 2 domain-containing protein
MSPSFKHLFANLPASSGGEDFLILLQTDHLRVERIVSNGQASPEDFWYDQHDDEWVLLFRGTAILQFDDESLLELQPGDSLLIPRHMKHRVKQTSPDAIWLAIHYTE